jgi:hypothetical protein
MKKDNTITKLFEGKEIRSVWDASKEDYYFSVVDVIGALTESERARKYWNDIKNNLKEDGSELSAKIGQLKLKSKKDGKYYMTDVLDTEGIFRLIESVPSPKAEPFKLWLAKLGKERVDEVFDPSIGIDKMIDFYEKKGYSLKWIEDRIRAIIDRKRLTNIWEANGITEDYEYAILTNDIYKEWSGMTASEYKEYKCIRKENLRDNMTDLEVAITNIGELATREISRKERPKGLKENRRVAKRGGSVAKKTKDFFEEETGSKIISKENNLNYKYEDNKQIDY